MAEKKGEKRFYGAVGAWFRSAKGCDSVEEEYRFHGLSLLTGDVVGIVKGTRTCACEVKLLPYPTGAAGYGAIGQALALKAVVPNVYVACVASDMDGKGHASWRDASTATTARKLLKHVGVDKPLAFEEYLAAVGTVFGYFYSDTKLGLLVVHDERRGRATVHEVVPARK